VLPSPQSQGQLQWLDRLGLSSSSEWAHEITEGLARKAGCSSLCSTMTTPHACGDLSAYLSRNSASMTWPPPRFVVRPGLARCVYWSTILPSETTWMRGPSSAVTAAVSHHAYMGRSASHENLSGTKSHAPDSASKWTRSSRRYASAGSLSVPSAAVSRLPNPKCFAKKACTGFVSSSASRSSSSSRVGK